MRHLVVRLAPAVLIAGLLSACASTATREVVKRPSPPQPVGHLNVPTPAPDKDVVAQLLAGQFAYNHDDLAAAATAYGKAAAVSDDPKVAQRAAELASATHDAAGARRAIQRWAALGASVAQLARARARLALDSGDTAGAHAQLEKLAASGDKNAWRMLGGLLMSTRDAAQAGQLLEAIATPDRLPPDSTAWLAMSELGNRLGRQAYARQLATEAVKRFHCADCYAWMAQIEFDNGQKQAARTLYAKAIAKAPDSTRLRLGYASLLGQTGDNGKAARMLAKGPQDADTYRARAAYAARANDMPEIARIYRDLQRAPDGVKAQTNYLLGSLAVTLGKSKQALAWFEQVPLDDDHRFDASMRSALIEQRAGNFTRAHAIAQQVQLDYADDPDELRRAVALDANLYMAERDYAKAIVTFSRALDGDADDAALLLGRGVAYSQAGNVDAAVADLRRVLKLKPGNIDAANALGFTLANANRDLAEAKTLIARAHKARPHDPSITDSWGWVQYRLGHLEAAEKALQQAWKTGKDPQIGAHLAEVLWKQGDNRGAREVLAAARKLAPHDAALLALAKKLAL